MKKCVVLLGVFVFLLLPGVAGADCWECVADQCDQIPWVGSINGHYGMYNCSQTIRCSPSGVCYTRCFIFGEVCTYWDVWF